MTIAYGTNMAILDVLPICIAVPVPIVTSSAVAPFTHLATVFLPEMIQ
jgi:hypothetical protein